MVRHVRGGRADLPSPWRALTDRDDYLADVATIRELIAAGETYQVNLSMRLRARIEGEVRGLYRDLLLAQRGGYGAFLDTGRYRIASASPELFFERIGDRITLRPMKGTAPRGRWLEEDDQIAASLAASEKDRAENAMIVDLERNDVGRIARWGSVEVPSMFDLERFETVWQMTSTVTGVLAPDRDLAAVFRALFPSGSVTGAPKVRTMGVIADLERDARGVYCGAIGFLSPPGSGWPEASFNVAIRTVTLDAESGTAEYGVGGGVTYASDPAREYDEAIAKSRVLTASRPAFALIETMRFEDDRYRNLDRHMARLAASADHFGFRVDPEGVEAALERAASSGPALVRLLVDRDGTSSTTLGDLPAPVEGPVRVAILEDDPVDPSDVWLFHKTTNRAVYERRRALRPDVEDVILVNLRGEVTESAIANVAARIDGRWWTPPRDCGLLAGIGREIAIADGTLAERVLTPNDLRRAADVALVSDVRGWREVEIVP